MNEQPKPWPVITVSITVDGKTFSDQQMQVNMDGLQAAIVQHALALTDANDRGDPTFDAAPLFGLCRMLAAARRVEAADVAHAAIAKATGRAP